MAKITGIGGVFVKATRKKVALVFFTNGDSGAALYAWLFRQLMNQDLSAFYWI